MKHSYNVRALWNEEAQVWYSDSDLVGLHIEATTFDDFRSLVHEFAAELVVTNHMEEIERHDTPLKDLVPAIVIERMDAEPRPQ